MIARSNRGLSLIELLVVIAIIGIIAAVGVPAYRGYVETSQMSRVNAAYEYSVRASRQEFAKDTTRVALGMNSTLPASGEAWIALFDPSGEAQAPGGGPAFIVSRVDRRRLTDPENTGAILLRYDSRRQRLYIGRPAYGSLDAFYTTVTRDEVDTQVWKDPLIL